VLLSSMGMYIVCLQLDKAQGIKVITPQRHSDKISSALNTFLHLAVFMKFSNKDNKCTGPLVIRLGVQLVKSRYRLV
jgi:hypothetical protein